MGLADYFDRVALAGAQALRGLVPSEFAARLERIEVEVVFGPQAAASPEGRAGLDLGVRLLARLYPTVQFRGPHEHVVELEALAKGINPRIGLVADRPASSLVVGDDAAVPRGQPTFIGSNGWTATVSENREQPVGPSNLPVGAGVAACLGAARIFRRAFADHGPEVDERLDVLATLAPGSAPPALRDLGTAVLLGAGAIGQATLWTIARLGAVGRLHVVDHERIDLSNLQRYVLSRSGQVGETKVSLASDALHGSAVEVVPHERRWEEFMAAEGTRWERVLVALDTVSQRREVQATLPRWIGNAWTQTGDLGLSTHIFGDGPCAWCLYLPSAEVPSEDELIAQALKLPYPQMRQVLRDLLYTGAPVPDDLLDQVGALFGAEAVALAPYRGQPLRLLYQHGICAGGLVATARADLPGELHVPLAHQSALAGVFLASALLLDSAKVSRDTTQIVRMDLMRSIANPHLLRPTARDGGRRCICRDPEFLAAYAAKWA